MKQVLMLVAVFGIALAASPLSAYEEAPVTDGGTITGKVLMKGEEPPAKAYNLVLFPEPAYWRPNFNRHGLAFAGRVPGGSRRGATECGRDAGGGEEGQGLRVHRP
ncbi:MAG: hypothetical protein V3R16_09815 [Nitrospirales bacterium]